MTPHQLPTQAVSQAEMTEEVTAVDSVKAARRGTWTGQGKGEDENLFGRLKKHVCAAHKAHAPAAMASSIQLALAEQHEAKATGMRLQQHPHCAPGPVVLSTASLSFCCSTSGPVSCTGRVGSSMLGTWIQPQHTVR